MNLAPNSASSMAVQLNEMKRMAAPYTSNCVKDWGNTNFTVPKEINYSLSVSYYQHSPCLTTTISYASVSATSQLWLATARATGQSSISHHSRTPANSSPSTRGHVTSRGLTTRTGSVMRRLSGSLILETGKTFVQYFILYILPESVLVRSLAMRDISRAVFQLQPGLPIR